MAEANEIRAALAAADAFMTLRSDIADVLKDGLKWSFEDQEIYGYDDTAEVIIAMFAERLSPVTQEGK